MSVKNRVNKIVELSLLLSLMVSLVLSLLPISIRAEETGEDLLTGSLDTATDVGELVDIVESAGSVVNFDDISLPGNMFRRIINYAGITWDYNLPDYWGGHSGAWYVWNRLSYATPASPPNYVLNGYGAINPGFNFGSQVNFDGAYFVKPVALSNPSALRFVGYISGVPTCYSDWLSLSSTPTYLSADFEGVDRVVIEMQGSGWFVMDDLSYNVVIPATVDIDPDTLNLKSNGRWMTAYIELPEGHDVATIVLDTVCVDGVQAVTDPTYDFVTDPNVYITDIDGDGVLERVVKFDRATVQATLTNEPDYDEAPKFYDLTLTVTGELIDGTLFEGEETITVIKR